MTSPKRLPRGGGAGLTGRNEISTTLADDSPGAAGLRRTARRVPDRVPRLP